MKIEDRLDRERLFRRTTTSENGCIVFTGYTDHGYGIFKYNGQAHKAHRIAYTLCVGPIPDGMFVLHKCDNPPCVNPDHLFIGTSLDNVDDMIAKGRAILSHRGMNNPRAIVSEADVLEIRRLYDEGLMTIAELSKRYGLTYRPTFNICHRYSWRHL